MLRIIFNDVSAREIQSLPLGVQLKLLMKLEMLPSDEAQFADRGVDTSLIDGRVFHRIREEGWSVYFEMTPEGLHVVRAVEE